MRNLVPIAVAVALVAASCSRSPQPTSSSTVAAINAPIATIKPPDTSVPTSTQTTTPPTTTSPTTTTTLAAVDVTTARPFEVVVPTSYDGSVAVPLVVLLHGYTASGALQEVYFKMRPLAETRGFLYVHPDGTTDIAGNKFWNGTDACCNLAGAIVDDSAYVAALIANVQRRYKVDPKRIFLVGHSNGGFMSYRMACDHAGTIAAIASLAGATFNDSAGCKPSEPVSVLQIHGTADKIISYTGGQILGKTYPPAAVTASTWAAYNGCKPTGVPSAAALDLEAQLAGAESSITTFSGCRPGGSVELWSIDAGAHTPALSPRFASSVIDFLLAHPKP